MSDGGVCLLTLRHERREWDLELPADVPVADLRPLLEQALGLAADPGLRLVMEPLGVVLHEDATLESSGVLDGARITLTREAPQPLPGRGEGPALGWRAIAPDSGAPPPSTSGYGWKRVDLPE